MVIVSGHVILVCRGHMFLGECAQSLKAAVTETKWSRPFSLERNLCEN